MIEDFRIQGFKEGLRVAKEAKQKNIPAIAITKNFIDDKEMAKKLMKDLKPFNVRWKKCFSLAIKYSFGYDDGLFQGAYSEQ